MSLSKKYKIPVPEKPIRHKSIDANSSEQSIRELVQAWRRLSAERRASKAISMPSSLIELNKLRRGQQTSVLQMRRRSSLKSKQSMQRVSVESPKSANVRVINYRESPRSSNVTRISMEEGTNLCYHEPINYPLPANAKTEVK